MMRKSGEKGEGTREVAKRPQTMGVHESSRRRVLRFSASLIHRSHPFVVQLNRVKRVQIEISPYRQRPPWGKPTIRARPPLATRLTRRAAKFYISCSHTATARSSHRSAKRLRSSVDVMMRMPLICQASTCRARSAPAIDDRPQSVIRRR